MGSVRKSMPGHSSDSPRTDGILRNTPNRNGLKTIRELAMFQFSCRRCEDAPCIRACPAQALEKDADGMVHRSTNLCVACKSCIVICPFGTIMNDFFEHHRTKDRYLDLDNPAGLQKFIDENPGSSVEWVEMEADPSQHIYAYSDDILIKEFTWDIPKTPEK